MGRTDPAQALSALCTCFTLHCSDKHVHSADSAKGSALGLLSSCSTLGMDASTNLQTCVRVDAIMGLTHLNKHRALGFTITFDVRSHVLQVIAFPSIQDQPLPLIRYILSSFNNLSGVEQSHAFRAVVK